VETFFFVLIKASYDDMKFTRKEKFPRSGVSTRPAEPAPGSPRDDCGKTAVNRKAPAQTGAPWGGLEVRLSGPRLADVT
jgi:rRNA maturation protein Nop10